MGRIRIIIAVLVVAVQLASLTLGFNLNNFKFSRTSTGGRKIVYKTEHSGLRGMIELVPVAFMVMTSLRASDSETESPNNGDVLKTNESGDQKQTPLESLMNKRNDVIGFNSDTLPPRRTKRKMAWPFEAFDASPLLDGTLGTWSCV